MNKSFNEEDNGHYLPPINRNQSANLNHKGKSHSVNDIKPVGSLNTTPVTRKLIQAQPLKNVQEYESMNEKELLREHQNLLKVLKKYQQLIDVSLTKKQKQKQREALHKAKHGDKKASKEELMTNQANNNKKIIANYLRQIKDLESAQKQRKLHQVLEEKSEIGQAIGKIKKEIFLLKNEDTMASRNLMTDRGHIEKDLNDAEKDLKIELTKNAEYKKKKQELTQLLESLKKDCANINIHELNVQSHQKDYMMALAQKKLEIQEAQRNYNRIQDTIQQVMIAKTKRNKGITKDIENIQKRITQLNSRIESHKQKVARYQKVIETQQK